MNIPQGFIHCSKSLCNGKGKLAFMIKAKRGAFDNYGIIPGWLFIAEDDISSFNIKESSLETIAVMADKYPEILTYINIDFAISIDFRYKPHKVDCGIFHKIIMWLTKV